MERRSRSTLSTIIIIIVIIIMMMMVMMTPGPASPSADPMTPGAWQGSHWNANFDSPDHIAPGISALTT